MRKSNQQNGQAPEPDTLYRFANSDDDNGMALYAKIEQLEYALQQKDRVLNWSLKEQAMLREQLDACIQSIQGTARQLTGARIDLKNNCRKILERVDVLEQENKALQCSNEAWSNRAIALQLGVLSAQNEAIKAKANHDLAFNKVVLLESQLKAVKRENDALKMQVNRQQGNGSL